METKSIEIMLSNVHCETRNIGIIAQTANKSQLYCSIIENNSNKKKEFRFSIQ